MLLRVTDAARRLACSPDFVRRALDRGELPYYQLGRVKRISEDDLEQRSPRHGPAVRGGGGDGSGAVAMTSQVEDTEEPWKTLRDIYDSARNPFTGQCRWCEAPPPDETHDHDVGCPAAKAAYALALPGYRDGSWLDFAKLIDRLSDAQTDAQPLTEKPG